MDLSIFLTYLAACGAAAATGAMFSPGEWYDGLKKPDWTPPRWVFPTAWTTLYLLSAVAAARLSAVEGNAQVMAFWAAQIAFNTLWSPVFFGLRKIKAALVPMAGLWLSVVLLTLWAFPLDIWSGLMLVPYVIWVSAAGALNLSVVRLNPGESG
ncbi:tryptophan-rich sensory protein [Rhodobacter sp. Har01]|uniref:tryptophan-rich sensory protein TspO n=1 Tax=Rhodobacter sp. Har01 TaxID=2883999 RepID=UPI001D060C8A|nr:TspO/MBR family protein [Rhodobacter sp. Har01]MCB6176822.1 tryptophan-rich sensory protein [Rhodobacter sp. Har01]